MDYQDHGHRHHAHHHHGHGHDHSPAAMMWKPLTAIGVVLLLTFTLAATWTEPVAQISPQTAMVGFRSLTFADGLDGTVVVTDAQTGEAVETLEAGNGFLRATLRALGKSRRDAGHPMDSPFHLEQYASGQLLLIDPTTERVIDLWAFGAPNKAVFEKYVLPVHDGDGGLSAVEEKS